MFLTWGVAESLLAYGSRAFATRSPVGHALQTRANIAANVRREYWKYAFSVRTVLTTRNRPHHCFGVVDGAELESHCTPIAARTLEVSSLEVWVKESERNIPNKVVGCMKGNVRPSFKRI